MPGRPRKKWLEGTYLNIGRHLTSVRKGHPEAGRRRRKGQKKLRHLENGQTLLAAFNFVVALRRSREEGTQAAGVPKKLNRHWPERKGKAGLGQASDEAWPGVAAAAWRRY